LQGLAPSAACGSGGILKEILMFYMLLTFAALCGACFLAIVTIGGLVSLPMASTLAAALFATGYVASGRVE